MMKKLFCILVTICLILGMLPVGVMAADESRSYDFVLSANGKQEITAATDDLVTMTLILDRTDNDENSEIYAVQAELLYDDTFFELVESSIMTADNVKWTDNARRTGGRAFYLNFLSLDGGDTWENTVQMGTFQFRVIGQNGASVVECNNLQVSTKDGTDTYAVTGNDVTVVVNTNCTVTFDSAGGSEVKAQTVPYGEKIQEPETPVREGYTFVAWYKDLDKTEQWDFSADTVKENMTLYAKWTEQSAPVVVPDTGDNAGSNSWIVLILLLLLLCLLVFLLIFIIKKNRKKEESCDNTQSLQNDCEKNNTEDETDNK